MEMLEMVLTEHPCLRGLNPQCLKILLNCASEGRFDPDQIIYREGDPAHQFFLIRHGRVGLEINLPNRGSVTIDTIGEGELLGWSWLIPPYKWQFTARALERTRTIAFDGQHVREQCEKDHLLGSEFYWCIADMAVKRLNATLLKLSDIYSGLS